MAHLVIKRVKTTTGESRYYYIAQSYRKGGEVKTNILEYLGKEPDAARLREAIRHWRVGQKRRRKGAKR